MQWGGMAMATCFARSWVLPLLLLGGALAPSLAAERSTARPPVSTPDLLALGKQTYEKQCMGCHGADGRGTGEAAYLLYPKPRDFVTASYAIVSTWERVPTEEDLFRTISRGMPGSAMPSWGHLPERPRWGLVHSLRSLAERPWETPAPGGAERSGVIAVPPEPPYDAAAQSKARELFAQACASCHGPTGRGDGAQIQFDEKGFPTRPPDLTLPLFNRHP